MDEAQRKPRWPRFLAGAVMALAVPFLPGIAGLEPAARATAGVVVITAWCWLSGALPLPVASLLPALLFPLCGVAPAAEVAPWYFKDILLLFLGGFVLALALERHGLHRRFAGRALRLFGARPRRVVAGFMCVTALLSMVISNTSASLLMLPVALALLGQCSEHERAHLAVPLLLGVAYAASIGGTATPVGTPPNLVLLGLYAERFPDAPEIGFGRWFLGAFPFALLFLAVAWWYLTRVARPLPAARSEALDAYLKEAHAPAPRTPAQNRVLGVFFLVAVLWMTRQGLDFGDGGIPGWQALLPPAVRGSVADSTVALLGTVLLFVLPEGRGGRGALMEWEDCARLPWGVLLLLGGGFALARGFEVSGLSRVIGDAAGGALQWLPPVATVLVVVLAVTFLTEVTSNTATVNVLLPILFSASAVAGVHPLLLTLPATLAVSCAFMLPVATPPNAIVFSSGHLRMGDMARAGVVLNLVTALLVTLMCLAWIAPAWDVDLLGEPPSWAAP